MHIQKVIQLHDWMRMQKNIVSSMSRRYLRLASAKDKGVAEGDKHKYCHDSILYKKTTHPIIIYYLPTNFATYSRAMVVHFRATLDIEVKGHATCLRRYVLT